MQLAGWISSTISISFLRSHPGVFLQCHIQKHFHVVRNQIAGYPCDHLVTASAQHSLQKITVTIFFFFRR